MKKILAALLSAAVLITCAAALSGCGNSVEYELKYDDEGNKYYSVACTGFTSTLKGELVIPAYYGDEGSENYAPVREIADEGFMYCAFSKVVIPETITKIGTAAFAYNSSLSEVEFAESIAIDSIPRGAFGYCSSLKSISIPDGVETIGVMAFAYCSSLVTVEIPEGVSIIGGRAFESCGLLASVTLPESLTTIGERAFYTTGLTEIVIPAGVRDTYEETVDEEGNAVTVTTYGIGVCAFHTCASLTRAVVNAQIGTLPSGVFGYCVSLTEIYLPATLKKVEGEAYASDESFYCGHAFHTCTSLSDVYFAGTREQWSQVEIESGSYTSNTVTYDNSALLNAAKHFG